MYDTIVMDYFSPNGGLLSSIPQYLIDPKRNTYEGVKVVTGYLPNGLQVTTSDKRLKTPKGNLSSYFFDNPFHTLRRGTTEEAIEKLSDELHLPMKDAKVRRIDIGNTFQVEHTEQLYFDGLGIHQHFTRLINQGSLYYKNQRGRTMIYYAKALQIMAKGLPIPESKRGKNYLRYECRFTHQLEKVFQQADIKASDLYDEAFYIHALTLWQKQYLEINKRHVAMNVLPPTGSTKELGAFLALRGLQELNQDQVRGSIKEWYIQGLISQKQATALRSYLSQLNTSGIEAVGNDLMTELTNKINRTVRHFR